MILYQATFFKILDAQFMGSFFCTVTAGLYRCSFIAIGPLDSCVPQKTRKKGGKQ